MNLIDKFPDNKIELIKEDFDDVNDEDCTTEQYISPFSCPIANALKRKNLNNISVAPSWITVDDITVVQILGGIEEVEACRKKLLKNEKAYIEIIKFN